MKSPRRQWITKLKASPPIFSLRQITGQAGWLQPLQVVARAVSAGVVDDHHSNSPVTVAR